MVKVITDKRECHCSAFNYCIDENCARWAEIVSNIGRGEDQETDRSKRQGGRQPLDLEHRY